MRMDKNDLLNSSAFGRWTAEALTAAGFKTPADADDEKATAARAAISANCVFIVVLEPLVPEELIICQETAEFNSNEIFRRRCCFYLTGPFSAWPFTVICYALSARNLRITLQD